MKSTWETLTNHIARSIRLEPEHESPQKDELFGLTMYSTCHLAW